MPLELNLLQFEKLAAGIYIAAYILLIVSANQSEKVLTLNSSGTQSYSSGVNPEQIVSFSSWMRVAGSVILSLLALTRLRELQSKTASGQKSMPVSPNIKITLGSFLSLLGTSLSATGATERAKTPGTRFTIL